GVAAQRLGLRPLVEQLQGSGAVAGERFGVHGGRIVASDRCGNVLAGAGDSHPALLFESTAAMNRLPATLVSPSRTAAQDFFVIEGGAPLSGRIRPEGNKNAALPLLAATLLTEDEVVLDNVPRIKDVETMLELLDDLGAQVGWTGRNSVSVRAGDIVKTTLDE